MAQYKLVYYYYYYHYHHHHYYRVLVTCVTRYFDAILRCYVGEYESRCGVEGARVFELYTRKFVERPITYYNCTIGKLFKHFTQHTTCVDVSSYFL